MTPRNDIVARLREKQRKCKGSARMDAWRTYGEAADELERAHRLIRRLCNAAPESPGCLYPSCDCGER